MKEAKRKKEKKVRPEKKMKKVYSFDGMITSHPLAEQQT